MGTFCIRPVCVPGWCLVAIAVFVMAATPAQAKRVALVIGNDAYLHVERLNNAGTDANAIAETLRQTGFSVTVKHDLSLQAMKESLRTFKTQIAGGDQVVFYYSGHGVQFGGTNYLIPVDLTPQNEEQVSDDAVPLQRVLDDLQDMKAGFALAIIDACRNNPFKDASRRAIGGRGLAPVTAATGQMVLYSAGAGQEALDSLGPGDRDPNGVFTRVLIREMRVPGVPAEQVLKRVRDQVVGLAQSVKHDQVPALYDQSLGEFYFVSGPAAAAAAPASGAGVPVQNAHELEQEYWNRIKASTDARDFQEYQRAFPQGAHTAEATLLTRKFAPQAPVAPPATVTTAGPPTRAVSVLIAPLTLNNRPVAQAETLMFDQVRSVPGLDPTLSSPGGASTADYGVGGNVLAARPTMTRNQCAGAAKNNKVNLGCLLGGSPAPYIASVPVQIDFRVSSRADNRVTPYLFSKSYQFPAQNQQEATSTAIEAAIKEGTLSALKSANIIDVTSDPKSKRVGYRVIASPAIAPVLVAVAETGGAASRSLAAASGTDGGVSGTWQGSYLCRQGRIGLKLTLTQGAPVGNAGVYAVAGTFEFFPLPDNPMAPAGSYAMEGRLAAGRLSLAGRRWIQQPPGIGMVGINGALANGVISGNIAGGGCSQFEVKRR